MTIDYPRAGRSGVLRFLPSWRQVLALGALGAFAVAGFVGVVYAMIELPDVNRAVLEQRTLLTYRDGEELGQLGATNRTIIGLDDVPVDVRRAVLAAENRDFYSDQGISPAGIARAAWTNLTGDGLQGGSTITQQYAKIAYLTQERTYVRKVKELFLAVKLDQERSKDQILEDYLNTIYFGRNAYGIQAAAEAYFAKDAAELELAEGAVLAALIRAPGAYDPDDNPERLRQRVDYVFSGMLEEGWASAEQARGARIPKIAERETDDRLGGPTGYLIETARRELLAAGFTAERIDQGGLQVRTTFDRAAQGAAVAAVKANLPEGARQDDLRVGLAAVEPGTGEVTAMYGGPDYVRRSVNNATQATAQAGSTFKPFTLAAALEQGIGLRSTYDGASPRTFPEYKRPVENFGGSSFGTIDLLTATANSVNTVYVDLALDVGPRQVVDVARRAGIPDSVEIEPTASVTLGPAAPHVIDIANAFATFAAEGRRAEPHVLLEVRGPDGSVEYEGETSMQRVFSKDVTADVSYALQGVVTDGSGFAAAELSRPSAGKTGTSQDNKSAWYVGYVPQLSAAVAMFRGDGTRSLAGAGGLDTVTGGSFPAQIWTAFMAAALDGQPVEEFPEPAFVGADMTPTPTATAPTATVTATPNPTPRGTTATPTPTETPSPTPTKTTPSPTPTRTSPSPTPTKTTPSPSPTKTSPTPTKTKSSATPTPSRTSASTETGSPTPAAPSPTPS